MRASSIFSEFVEGVAVLLEMWFDFKTGKIDVGLLEQAIKLEFGGQDVDEYHVAICLYYKICDILKGEPLSASYANKALRRIILRHKQYGKEVKHNVRGVV